MLIEYEILGLKVVVFEPCVRYGVKSRSEDGIYRIVEVFIQDDEVILECDCPSGYYRGAKATCKHKQVVLPVLERDLKDRQEINDHIGIDIN